MRITDTVRLYSAVYIVFCAISSLAESGFILTAPKVLDADSTEYITLSLFDVPPVGSISVRLLKAYSDVIISETTLAAHNNHNNWGHLEIPDIKDSVARLQIYGKFTSSNEYQINATKEIRIRHKSVIIFIQTDKPIYKPGQFVKFRVLPMDNQLLPLKGITIGDVWIEDPSGIRIEQWKKVNFSDGIIQLEMPLSEEPVLGAWTIYSRIRDITNSQTFQVDEYVLPKYDITIIPPPYIMADAQEIQLKICAEYTYGKKVDGFLKAKVSYQLYSYENENEALPFVEHEGPISGCADYTVQAEDIHLHHRKFGYRMIEIFAEVVENSTGIKQNSTKLIEISHSPLEITFLGASKDSHYFKPGLPYYGEIQLTKPDGSIATSEEIKICSKPKRNNLESNTELCNLFTSDQDGRINFIVPPQTSSVNSIVVEAKSFYEQKTYGTYGVKIYSSYSNIYLRPWHSPSNSHLQIEPITRQVECDKLEKVKIRYTTHDGSTIKFYHQVISRGRIVQQGSHHRTFSSNNETPIDLEDPRMLHNRQYKPIQFGAQPLSGVESLDEDKIPTNKTTMVGEFQLSFDARATMSPTARILVFYVRKDGEVVADTRTFQISHCLQNQVKLHFRHPQQYPNTEAALLVSASANSICGIGLIDKSIHLLNREKKFEKRTVFDLMETFDVDKNTLPKQISKDYCRKDKNLDVFRPGPPGFNDIMGRPPDREFGLPNSPVFEDIPPGAPIDDILRRRKRFIGMPMRTHGEFADTMTAFEEAGMVVITDFTLENRPCQDIVHSHPRRFRPVSRKGKTSRRLSSPRGIQPEEITAAEYLPEPVSQTAKSKPPLEIRSYFPETWLWELHNIGSTGEMALKRELPHTITKWVGQAVCVHPETGLGISDDSGITAFQPFFVSLSLPYSVIRGEVVSIVITVFNYLSECLPIKLSLEASETFKIMDESPNHKLCVCGEKSASWPIKIQPISLGNINITVYAYSLQADVVCENEITARLSARDAITKPLLVEAEGFPKEETINIYFCPEKSNGTYDKEIYLLLPDDTVDQSARGYMSITGGLMGPALNGLENLVRLPVGCGEQNMVLFTPNIYILDYLTATHRLTDDIRHKAMEYLKTGYQRELKYRHKVGSYSAFGIRDIEGSMWLTAFVVKSFAQARRFISIDEGDLAISTAWIVQKQLENGCFPATGELFQKALKGGLEENAISLAPLTAFVLISLLESNYRANETVNSAVFCLKSEKYPSTYSLALFAYATALAKSTDAEGYLHYLENRATKTEHFQYWDDGGQGSKAINVEIAGYTILTMLELYGSNSLARALPIVRWITQQRNSNGGFVSTQDTVVALQALAKYGSYISGEEVNIDLTIENDELVQKFKVDETNMLVMQSVKLPSIPTIVDFIATGQGCALAQFFVRYNVEFIPEIDIFYLKVVARRSSNSGCDTSTVRVCMRYNLPKQVTNMVIVETKVASGYVPDEFELHMLHNNPDLELKRHDVKQNKIIFYFSKLTNEERCFEFYLKSEINVENQQDATVKMYDYYQPELHTVTSYRIPTDCSMVSTNDEPQPSPLPINAGFDINPETRIDDGVFQSSHTTNESHDFSETTNISTDTSEKTGSYGDLNENVYLFDTTESHVTRPNQDSMTNIVDVETDAAIVSEDYENTNNDVLTGPSSTVTTLMSTSIKVTTEDDLTNDIELSDGTQHLEFESLVSIDQDLNFPDGLEANQPVFVDAPGSLNSSVSGIPVGCPQCFEDFPESFYDLYCNASFVIRVSIRNVETGRIKILNDVSAQLPKPKAIKEYGRLIYQDSCDCLNIKQIGNVFIAGLHDELWQQSSDVQWQQSSDVHHIILNSDALVITAPDKVVRPPAIKKAWSKCNK